MSKYENEDNKVEIEENDIVRYVYSDNINQLYIVRYRSPSMVRIHKIDNDLDSRWVSKDACIFVGVASKDFKYNNAAKTCPLQLEMKQTTKTETPAPPKGAPNKPILPA